MAISKFTFALSLILCFLQRFNNTFQSFVGAVFCLVTDAVQFVGKYQIICITGCLEHEHIPIPYGQKIQIILNVHLVCIDLLKILTRSEGSISEIYFTI